MKVFNKIVLFAAFVEYSICQSLNDLDLDDFKKNIGDHIPEINSFDSNTLNSTNLPRAEDVENVFKEKCKKNGAENAVDSLKDEQENVKFCIEKYVNFTIVQEELEKAKETGSMDEVFGKYCKKWPSIYACFDNVSSTARSCMDNREETAFNQSLDILGELQEFVCFKDGDRLAMFVAEGGIECIQKRKRGVQDCINSTLGARLPDPDDLSVSTLPTFLFSHKDCEDFDKVRECVNGELEKCKDSTPANIVDAFFKFLKKHMPCGSGEAQRNTVPTGSSWSIRSSILLVITFLLSVKIC